MFGEKNKQMVNTAKVCILKLVLKSLKLLLDDMELGFLLLSYIYVE